MSAAPSVAQNAETQALVNRLDRLERSLQLLERQVFRGEKPPNPPALSSPESDAGASAYAARIADRLTQFETELRQVTGQIEKLTFNVDRVNQRLDKLVSDVDFRLSTLEKRQTAAAPGAPAAAPAQVGSTSGSSAAGTSAPTPPARRENVAQVGRQSGGPVFGTAPRTLGTVTDKDLAKVPLPSENSSSGAASVSMGEAPEVASAASTKSVLPKGTAREQYQYAFSLLRRADYDQAETAFREFVQAHPKDELTSNARYWLGETYYVRGDYVNAADTFLGGYRENPKGAKAPDTLLKLGMSLSRLDKNKDACATFNKLTKDFAEIPRSVERVLSRERDRADCK